jgi:hypothetical protein
MLFISAKMLFTGMTSFFIKPIFNPLASLAFQWATCFLPMISCSKRDTFHRFYLERK